MYVQNKAASQPKATFHVRQQQTQQQATPPAGFLGKLLQAGMSIFGLTAPPGEGQEGKRRLLPCIRTSVRSAYHTRCVLIS
jgi:hypothetical protein